MKKEIEIEGMMCENCVKHVTKALESIDGVKKAKVSLKKKNALINSSKEISNDLIKDKVADIGYTVVNIKNL